MIRLLKWFGVGLGVLVLFVFVNVLWFVTGKPTVSVNYVKQLNELVRPVGATDDQNACSLFLEATDLYIEPDEILNNSLQLLSWMDKYDHSFFDLPESNQTEVRRWVKLYFELDAGYYDNLKEEAINKIAKKHTISIPFGYTPGMQVLEVPLLFEEFFPGLTLESWSLHDRLNEFGWKTSGRILNGSFRTDWNQAIGALILREWIDQCEVEHYQIPRWLELNEPAWKKLEAGSRCPYFWYKYYESGMMPEAYLSDDVDLHKLIELGRYKIRLAQDQGKTDEALTICTTIFRVCRLVMEPNNDTTTHLIANMNMVYPVSVMLRLLTSENFTVDAISKTQNEIEGIFRGDYPLSKSEVSRMEFLDLVQRSFTDGGIGGGHLIPGALENAFGMEKGEPFDIHAKYTFGFFECWNHAGRDKTLEEANRLYDHFDSISLSNLYERQIKKLNINDKLESLPVEKFSLVHLWLEQLDIYSSYDYRGKAWYEGVITVLALKRWVLEEGEYPENLSKLVKGGYLEALPDDPFGPGELVYERRGEDFILYSWGADFDDDGGEHDISWGEGAAGGDYVFGPIRD